MLNSTRYLSSTNFIFCRISLVRPCLGLLWIKGFTNFKTKLKPTLNKFCLRGSVCSFIANTIAAFIRQVSSKSKNAIEISRLGFTRIETNFLVYNVCISVFLNLCAAKVFGKKFSSDVQFCRY